jgi:hypothetical protein
MSALGQKQTLRRNKRAMVEFKGRWLFSAAWWHDRHIGEPSSLWPVVIGMVVRVSRVQKRRDLLLGSSVLGSSSTCRSQWCFLVAGPVNLVFF